MADCPDGLAEEEAAALSIASGGLAVAAATEAGSGTLSVRDLLAAGAASAAAVIEVLVLRALVGGPSSACLALFLGLAAVCPP